MTAAVWIALVVLAILTLGNLLLLFGVIRRLRYVQELVTPDVPVPSVGTRVQPFAVRGIDGTVIDDVTLSNGTALLALITTTCPACQEMVRSLATLDLRAESTFVFIVRDEETKPDEAITKLSPVARIAIVDRADAAIHAFGEISGFPTVVVSKGGEVVRAGTTIEAVRPALRGLLAEAVH